MYISSLCEYTQKNSVLESDNNNSNKQATKNYIIKQHRTTQRHTHTQEQTTDKQTNKQTHKQTNKLSN